MQKEEYNFKINTMGGLTDVPGILVGTAEDESGRTGCTVVICPNGAVPGVSVVGGNPGTMETDSIRPGTKEDPVQAVLLTGGSRYGLAAASGVMRWLYEQHIAEVPHDKEGSFGAGAGATIGKFYGEPMKGGQGTASIRIPGGPVVAALAIVNPLGDVWEHGNIVVGALCPDGNFVNQTKAMLEGVPSPLFSEMNTTIAVVATTAQLNKAEAGRVAALAQDGMARAISPVHSQWDGDTVFCLATGADTTYYKGDAAITVIGTAAAVVLEKAIIRGALAAQSKTVSNCT
ncbi:P1 family peptidase [Anaerocolumna jejuensis]|uniref:P1 family peptidase n=1 Tax=Anaerocolumna jejuensis TaxID=259063 RepID=UPI003F7B901F